MALLVGSGSGGGTVAPPPRVAKPIVYPTPPKTTSTRTYTPSKSKTSSGGRTSSSGRTSTAKAVDPYAKARADQLADQKKAETKAAKRLTSQAERLKQQADALKIALGAEGFLKTLRQELKNADLEYSEEDALILGQYARGKEALERQAGTAEDNRGRSAEEALNNAGRERNEALQQGIANGVGALDMLKAQSASLRNWAFNVGQVQSNYNDEMNSLQSEHSQMVNSVVTGRQTAWREREQQYAQLYRGYYDNRGQVLTEVGNKLGEASQYYDMANEQVESKKSSSAAKAASDSALANLRAAAKETGKSYVERATPDAITKWEGTAKIENRSQPRQWGQQTVQMKDAEGATLRRWEG